MHIRNAPAEGMEQFGYHEGYKYPHDYMHDYCHQQYMPDALKDVRLWHGQHNPNEEKLYQRMVNYWGKRYEQ